jgi:hypothetical protein
MKGIIVPKLQWGEQGSSTIGSVEELDELLDRLTIEAEQREPFIVELTAENGATLSAGLGRAESVVDYVPSSLDPPYFQSVGTKDSNSDETIMFRYQGDWSEFPRRSAVAVNEARNALRQFLRTGTLPSNLDWKEV